MSDSDLPEISKAVRPDTTSVWLACPHCHECAQHRASAWHQINIAGVFEVAPTVTYGVVCKACEGAFYFRPKTAEHTWPDGPTMDVACPNCASTVTTHIAIVREEDVACRPEDCETCLSVFEVYPDGKTVAISVPATGPITARGKELIGFFQSFTFDPDGARDWPFTTEVETLVTVAWLYEFEDGTCQFMDAHKEPPQVYSPRMTPEALELFCKVNIETYRAFHEANEDALDRRESVPMASFW